MKEFKQSPSAKLLRICLRGRLNRLTVYGSYHDRCSRAQCLSCTSGKKARRCVGAARSVTSLACRTRPLLYPGLCETGRYKASIFKSWCVRSSSFGQLLVILVSSRGAYMLLHPQDGGGLKVEFLAYSPPVLVFDKPYSESHYTTKVRVQVSH